MNASSNRPGLPPDRSVVADTISAADSVPDTAAGLPTGSLVVRRLMVDLKTPMARHWCGGDAFKTAFFDALSMSFPSGEQFFIDSIRRGMDKLSPTERERFEDEARGFIGQEATHRHLHDLFNRQRATLGRFNHWDARIRRRRKAIDRAPASLWLGGTAASEHFTSILADYLLRHPEVFDGTEERLRTFWTWHAAEESEHRCTAFDLFRAVGGSEAMRRYTFVFVTMHFLTDVLRQTVNNLWHDKTLFQRCTWRSAMSFLFGRGGMVRESAGAWREYLQRDFHPAQSSGERAAAWLAEHADVAVPVRGAPALTVDPAPVAARSSTTASGEAVAV